MAMHCKSSVLQDVVAYVDVWSSEKTANYSKPFVHQLQEMGAQVTKTFNKEVTHVVYSNGHPATWRKAKKSGVRLVSVLWVGSCYQDGVQKDEDLFPAISNENNPVLKNKKHRCMQPKDSPESTPENDKRIKRKLDRMMRDLPPRQPLVTDISPIIIDEENGIVYSPLLRRSDYMAQRLKAMKEKREDLSPTASQMIDTSSPIGQKPSPGSSPTDLKFKFDSLSAPAAESDCSPDKEEKRMELDFPDYKRFQKHCRKSSDKPWLSPCHSVPKIISSPLKCPVFEDDEEGKKPQKSRWTSVKKKLGENSSSVAPLESPLQDTRPEIRSGHKWITSPLKCPNFDHSEEKTQPVKSRRKSVRKKSETNKTVGLLESPLQVEASEGTNVTKIISSAVESLDVEDDEERKRQLISRRTSVRKKPKEKFSSTGSLESSLPEVGSTSGRITSLSSLKCSVFDKSEERQQPVKSRRKSVRQKSETSKTVALLESPPQVEDFRGLISEEHGEGDDQKSSRVSFSEKLEICNSVVSLKRPCQDTGPMHSTVTKTVPSRLKDLEGKGENSGQKSRRPPVDTSKKGKLKTDETFSAAKTNSCPDYVNSQSFSASVVTSSRETVIPLDKAEQKISKRARPSLSALARSLTIPDGSPNVPSSADANDDVFEDYFSPCNKHKKMKNPLLPNLPTKSDIQIPFQFEPISKKRKDRRSEGPGFESSGKKRRKLEEGQGFRNQRLHSDSSSHPQQDVEEPPPVLHSKTLLAKKQRQCTLPFTRTNTKTESDDIEQRTPPAQQASTGGERVPTLVKESEVCSPSGGNELADAAGVTESPSEGEEAQTKLIGVNALEMGNKTKIGRTLVTTSMPAEKQDTVFQVVKALGGFTVVDRVCESTTHVVSGGHRRTINVLLAIARGCWILSFEWIMWCLEQGQWIPEEPYELSDQFPAAQICRLQRHLSAGEHQQDLFHDQPAMFVCQHSKPPVHSLVELIELCGGTVCKTLRQAGLCIGKYNGRRPEGTRMLSEQWVLDSITHLKQLPYDSYYI